MLIFKHPLHPIVESGFYRKIDSEIARRERSQARRDYAINQIVALIDRSNRLGLSKSLPLLQKIADESKALPLETAAALFNNRIDPACHRVPCIFSILPKRRKYQVVKELVEVVNQGGLTDEDQNLECVILLAALISQPERDRLLNRLSAETLRLENVWALLSLKCQLANLVAQVNEMGFPNGSKILAQLSRLASEVAQPDRDRLLGPLLHEAKRSEEIFALLSIEGQCQIVDELVVQVNRLGLPEGTEILALLAKLAAHVAQPERDETLRDLITGAKVLPAIFTLFEVDTQAEISMDEFCEGRFSLCLMMNIGAQIRSIYRAAKFKRNISKPEGPIENLHPLFRACLVLLWAKDKSERVKTQAFFKAHRYIEDWVINEAWNDLEPLDFTALVPHCTVRDAGVLHCEGRLNVETLDGNPKSQKDPYCGRLRWLNQRSYCSEARVLADLELPWNRWSLLELLATTGIDPCVEGLRHSLEYVPKLGGWVNRLNEIRSHLKCSKCGIIMRPNYAYARFAARFNATVVTCPSGAGHDEGVYLNQCWGCESHIIDSRYDFIKHEGFYLCLKCGSGPKTTEKFSQGDSCPKCGSGPMAKQANEGFERTCDECDHKIILPPRHKITPRRYHGGQDDFDQSDEIK